jgi:hypothetical protein
MTVDVESLSAVEFLMMLNYEGNPPDDPAFDKIRMSPEEWRTMFPAAVATTAEEVPDDAAAPADAGPGGDPTAAEAPV